MIFLKGVDKVFHEGQPKEFFALRQVGLEVQPGELAVIHGVSGSGKTTLLSILGGLSKPTRGLVQVAGQNIAKLPDAHISKFRRSTLGFVFQHHNLFHHLSVRDNVQAPLVPAGHGPRVMKEKVQAALELAGIGHKAGQKVADLSGGERQRCGIARAVVADPEIILCDEPTAHLDDLNTENLVVILRQFQKSGKTVVVSTHDPRLIELSWVDQRVHLHEGRGVST